jgi:hypothetical protein
VIGEGSQAFKVRRPHIESATFNVLTFSFVEVILCRFTQYQVFITQLDLLIGAVASAMVSLWVLDTSGCGQDWSSGYEGNNL